MRHRMSGRQLGRNSSSRAALFRSLAVALIKEEQIKTTLPKAKELRIVAERLITIAKNDTEELLEFGDVNNDGKVSVADARKIVVAIAKNDFNF